MEDIEIISLSQKILQIDTTNPPGDQIEAVNLLTEQMEKIGGKTKIHYVKDAPSLIAEFQAHKSGNKLCWIGHWDTVPTGPINAWTKSTPWEGKISEGVLYGRGACDMKTALIAAWGAASEWVKNPTRCGTLVLAFFADEENGGQRGASQLMKQLNAKYRFDYGLVGEPTNFNITIARRGVCWGYIHFFGKQAHAARPDEGDNPIYKMARAVRLLENLSMTYNEDIFLGKPTLSVTTARSGNASNVIPHNAKIGVDIRTVPGQTHEKVVGDIQNLLLKNGFKNDDFKIDLGWLANPYKTDNEEYIRACTEIVEDVMDRSPEISGRGGTSDGRFLSNLGVPVVEIGLENTSLHQVNEFCRVDSIITLKKIYTRIFEHFLTA